MIFAAVAALALIAGIFLGLAIAQSRLTFGTDALNAVIGSDEWEADVLDAVRRKNGDDA